MGTLPTEAAASEPVRWIVEIEQPDLSVTLETWARTGADALIQVMRATARDGHPLDIFEAKVAVRRATTRDEYSTVDGSRGRYTRNESRCPECGIVGRMIVLTPAIPDVVECRECGWQHLEGAAVVPS